MAVAQTTTIFSSAIIIVLFSSSIVAHTSGDVGGKPKAADFVTKKSTSRRNSVSRPSGPRNVAQSQIWHVDGVTVSITNVCTALLKDYRGPDGGDNDGPPSFMLPHCVEQVNTLSGYCGHELLDMPELHALFNENLDLSMLAHLNMALLAPYRDNDS
uniref:Prolamin-like domain-containing protein n=1 Tax=Aegilops tauschii TaxID=37682 RepID=M8AS97_AEGTA